MPLRTDFDPRTDILVHRSWLEQPDLLEAATRWGYQLVPLRTDFDKQEVAWILEQAMRAGEDGDAR